MYLCIFIFISFFTLLNKKYQQNWTVCLFLAVILILIAALRHDNIGIDTIVYKYMFISINNGTYGGGSRIEEGFLILNELVGRFGDYRTMFLVVALLSILPVCYIVKKYSSYPCYSFLLFYASVLFHTMEMAAMRQAAAFGFVVLAFHFMMKRNLTFYLLMIFLAFTMHKSSLVFIPCYWLYNIVLNKKIVIAWLVLLGLNFVIGYTLFLKLNALWSIDYTAKDVETGGERFFIVNLFIVLLGLINYKKINNNPYVRVPLLIYSISVLLWPMLNSNPALFRLQYYFDFFYTLYIPNYVAILTNDKKYKLKYALIVASIMIALYVVMIFRGVPEYYPYYFFWE